MGREAAALGLTVHTGWASCVVAAGSAEAPRIVLREIIEVLDDADRFVYHVAESLPLARAEKSVATARAKADQRAVEAVKRLIDATTTAGHRLVGCAIVAKKNPMPGSVADIVAAHPRIHTAEGAFHRDVLVQAAGKNRLRSVVVAPGDDALASQASLAPLAKTLGRPWSKDERLAALAAWNLLAAR